MYEKLGKFSEGIEGIYMCVYMNLSKYVGTYAPIINNK